MMASHARARVTRFKHPALLIINTLPTIIIIITENTALLSGFSDYNAMMKIALFMYYRVFSCLGL